ncbi:MAG: hypothetical protein ACRDQZ_10340 [Mycobacteriales bacterium]
MTPYVDIASMPEDRRIDLIGHRAVVHKESVAFVVEDDEKADRYIAKLRDKYPTIQVNSRGAGPVKGTIYVKVGPRTD